MCVERKTYFLKFLSKIDTTSEEIMVYNACIMRLAACSMGVNVLLHY